MSWFKKAEDFLNNLDKSAAVAINGSTDSGRSELPGNTTQSYSTLNDSYLGTNITAKHDSSADSMYRPQAELAWSSMPESRSGRSAEPTRRQQTNGLLPAKSSDDLIIDFLNDSSKSLDSAPAGSDKAIEYQSDSMSRLKSNQSAVRSGEPAQHVSGASSNGSAAIENQLLKQELSSLNKECQTLLKTQKQMQQELLDKRKLVQELRSQLSEKSIAVGQRDDQLNDLVESLKAKDSQLGVLRVRYDELQQELTSKADALTELRSRHELFAAGFGDSSSLNSVVDQLSSRIRDLESALDFEKGSRKLVETELREKAAGVERHNAELLQQLGSAQHMLNAERAARSNLQMQLSAAQLAAESADAELGSYKSKAARILHAKEKLIASLQQSADRMSPETGEEGVAEGDELSAGRRYQSVAELSVELEEQRVARERAQSEASGARAEAERLQARVQTLEAEGEAEAARWGARLRGAEQQLAVSRQTQAVVEEETERLRASIDSLKAELSRVRLGVIADLQARDTEIKHLQQQLALRQRTKDADECCELENRIRALTESLIQKQTALEALTSEKNSLWLQLERLQSTKAGAAARGASAMVALGDVTDTADDVRHRWASAVLPETLFDTPMTRRVKRAVNGVDRVSHQLSHVLYRNAHVRLALVIYTVLLHLWVGFVLLTYQPEAHSAER